MKCYIIHTEGDVDEAAAIHGIFTEDRHEEAVKHVEAHNNSFNVKREAYIKYREQCDALAYTYIKTFPKENHSIFDTKVRDYVKMALGDTPPVHYPEISLLIISEYEANTFSNIGSSL